MEVSLSPAERKRLASLLAAVANVLLLLFVLAVALPLLPLKLIDPFWLLAFTGAVCTNGFLALLAVVLLNLAAALLPQADWLMGRRQLVGGLCRWVALAFLLLIPLQGLAAWQALDQVDAASSRESSQQLERIAQFRQAVNGAGSMAALQANLASIQAPPLGPEDQRQNLAALKANLLSQLQAAERRSRDAASSGAPGTALVRRLEPGRLMVLLKDSLRVLLLSLGLCLGFAAAAQRKGSELSLRMEWGFGLRRLRDPQWRWHKNWRIGGRNARPSGRLGRLGSSEPPDAAYFQRLAAEQEDPPPG